MTFEPGSSPHVRGARYYNHAEGGVAGIIPACAGSTIFVIPSYLPSRDHPRMCGEHKIWTAGATAGSGIIPACAGSTFTSIDNDGTLRDHPRMCGEHNMFSQPIPYEKGSSPHVRGAR